MRVPRITLLDQFDNFSEEAGGVWALLKCKVCVEMESKGGRKTGVKHVLLGGLCANFYAYISYNSPF